MSPDKLVDENDPSTWVAKTKVVQSGPGKIHEVILVIFGRSRSRQQRVNITSITVFWQILYMKF